MKTSRFTDSQVVAVVKQAEAVTPLPGLNCEHGMSSATLYEWRAKYGGMDAGLMTRMKHGSGERLLEDDVCGGTAKSQNPEGSR